LDERIAASDDTDPYQQAADRHDVRRTWEAVFHLTDEQQQVISLRFIAGYSIAEVARTLGKTEGAVKALQHRGLASLRRLLEIES
jgi:RNA polymerase sigma-70 factor (ECF subfamily)